MAAGLGFKTFTTGEVLTAADTNGYLMQGILVFADATARDAAITAPEEGQFAYLKDTNVTTYYTGSAWANVDTTGMTNPMTTTGDVIYSSSGSTPAALGIGTVGQVLTVNSGATAPEWAAPAAGGKVLQVVEASFATEVNTTSTSYEDLGLSASITPASASNKVLILGVLNAGKTGTDTQTGVNAKLFRGATDIAQVLSWAFYTNSNLNSRANAPAFMYLDSPATTSSTTYKIQVASSASGSNVLFNWTGSGTVASSRIFLLEIGA